MTAFCRVELLTNKKTIRTVVASKLLEKFCQCRHRLTEIAACRKDGLYAFLMRFKIQILAQEGSKQAIKWKKILSPMSCWMHSYCFIHVHCLSFRPLGGRVSALWKASCVWEPMLSRFSESFKCIYLFIGIYISRQPEKIKRKCLHNAYLKLNILFKKCEIKCGWRKEKAIR